MKTVIVKALSKAPVLFAAFFFFTLFYFAKPVEVKAETKTIRGNVSTTQFGDGDEINIDGDTTININSDVTINSLNTPSGGSFTITITGNAENTLTCVDPIILISDSLIMESGNVHIDHCNFKNITINGGTIEASVPDDYHALWADNTLTIRGGCVKASSTGAHGGCGILATGDITISGGEIEAIGKIEGIYSSGGDVSISDGNTIVKAKTTSDNTNYYSIEAHGRVTIEDPLMVTDPAGGGVSSDGKYIATTIGGTERATQVEIRRPKHSVTVANDGHGTGTADPNSAPGDAIIRLSATPENGYVFDEWTSEDGVTFADSKSADTTFRMLDRNVSVKANFKQEIPTEQKCTITFDKNGGSGSLSPQEVNKGAATKLKKNTFTRDGYEFKNWNTKSDGNGTSYADEANITANTDLTLYAQWKKSGGRGEKIEGDGVTVEKSPEVLQILNNSLPPELKEKVEKAIAEGKEADFVFISNDLGDSAEGAGDIRKYNDSQGFVLGKLFDLTLLVRTSTGEELGRISNTSDAVGLEVLIPDELYSSDRIFYILRFHEGSVTEVGSGRGHTVPIKTDGFSTYAIAYKEVPEEPHDDEKHEDKKRKEKDHTPPSWVLNPNEKQALGITYTGLAPGTTAGYQEQGEVAKALLAAATPKGWIKAFSFNLLNGGVPDQTLKLGTLTMFIHPEWQKAGRQYAMLSLDRYGNVAFLPDIDTDPIRCTVNLNFEGYALDVLYKDP